ncbi:MAG: dockerin type I domain-containing protein [Chthoniobacterales bacterium]
MSGGVSNNDRFEQIGQSWLKHGIEAVQEDACGLGCIPAKDQFHLGVGCSDPYFAALNASQNFLGSRAWVNPFTGAFPAAAINHSGHSHSGTAHRLLVESSDLDTATNPGATYYAEAQYITRDEYAWCQAHPGECNMSNNASYRRFNVTGTGSSFSFSPVGSTVQTASAIHAWTGATINLIEPVPGIDGQGFVGYKVTNPGAGVWHYEYAIYNQNLDRAIQSFSVPLGCGITVSNLGFHAPPNHPGFPNDGTVGDAGFSNAAWTSNQTTSAVSWNTEAFAQNPNANAIRFGTLYNFRFDSDRPPQAANASVGFFKTGTPIMVPIQGPSSPCTPLQLASAVSRKTHGGAGDFDVALPLTGEPGVECRASGGNHTIVVAFSNPPVSGNAAVTSGTGSVSGSPAFNGNTMTIGLTGIADVQKITVTLSNVTDSFAQVMPDTPVSVNILSGDVNGSKNVNATDVGQAKAQSALAVTSANFRNDVNASGTMTGTDIAQVKASAGNTVP